MIPYLDAISLCSSTSTLANDRPFGEEFVVDNFSKMGAIILHGGHHEAVKSIRT